MKKTAIKLLCCLLAVCAICIPAAGCGIRNNEPKAKTYDKAITIDVFSNRANYQGIATGWYAEYVRKKFNMELNIIAPNVAGGGDTLFQTRSAAGNLGDLIMVGAENGRLADAVNAGLMYDITDMVMESDNLPKYMDGINNIKKLISSDRIYAIPSEVSELSPLTPSEGLEPTYGPYIRWDLYMAIGTPPMNTLEDLLPVLKRMQERNPISDSGRRVYAISLFKDWDSNMMCLAKQPACMYGMDENGFTLLSADGKRFESIIDESSMYIRALKFFFKANQMGILDPDSPTQNWETLFAKTMDGAVLWSPWPYLGQAAYNTVENKNAGKGFMFAPVQDMKIYSNGCRPLGNGYVVGVGSRAQDPQRMVDFIDWLYSPEGVEYNSAQSNSTCGPKGLTWEMKDGQPVLTDFGIRAFNADTELMMPAEWGGGTYRDGISQLNYKALSYMDINPFNGQPYNPQLWPSVIAANTSALDKSWQDFMKARTTLEYLQKHNMLTVAAGNGYIPEAAPAEIDTIRSQCKAIIVGSSWQMVFARDEAEFNQLLRDMRDTCVSMGYNQALEFDIKIAECLRKAREDAIAAAK